MKIKVAPGWRKHSSLTFRNIAFFSFHLTLNVFMTQSCISLFYYSHNTNLCFIQLRFSVFYLTLWVWTCLLVKISDDLRILLGLRVKIVANWNPSSISLRTEGSGCLSLILLLQTQKLTEHVSYVLFYCTKRKPHTHSQHHVEVSTADDLQFNVFTPLSSYDKKLGIHQAI